MRKRISSSCATEEQADGLTPDDPGPSLQIRAIVAVVVEMQNTGGPANRSEIVASIEHALYQEQGDWRVSIVGSRGSDDWELKVEGPRGFERIYTLSGSAGEHQPDVIRSVLIKLLSSKPKAV